MTKFVREQFIKQAGHITYCLDPMPCAWERRKFIGRFKYAAASSVGPAITFLIKNFTVEEYLGRLDAGESPAEIMESKGFVLSHIKKLLTKNGYAPTVEGYKEWLAKPSQFPVMTVVPA